MSNAPQQPNYNPQIFSILGQPGPRRLDVSVRKMAGKPSLTHTHTDTRTLGKYRANIEIMQRRDNDPLAFWIAELPVMLPQLPRELPLLLALSPLHLHYCCCCCCNRPAFGSVPTGSQSSRIIAFKYGAAVAVANYHMTTRYVCRRVNCVSGQPGQ